MWRHDCCTSHCLLDDVGGLVSADWKTELVECGDLVQDDVFGRGARSSQCCA